MTEHNKGCLVGVQDHEGSVYTCTCKLESIMIAADEHVRKAYKNHNTGHYDCCWIDAEIEEAFLAGVEWRDKNP